MGPGKPGKSWNFIMAFSRTEKRPLVLESSENLLNATKKYELCRRQLGKLTVRSWECRG